MVRPLLPVRYTMSLTPLQNQTKSLFEQTKELGLRSLDLPWAAGLFLSAGSGQGQKIVYNLSQLHRDVAKDLKRIFDALKCRCDYDHESSRFSITLTTSLF